MEDRLDEDLVARLTAGDVHTFESVLREYGPSLLRTGERILADPFEAQDCLQETFISVHIKIASFRGDSSLKTWLHRIMVNNCLMKLRARRDKPTESLDGLEPVFDTEGCRIEPLWQVPVNIEEIIEQRDVQALVLEAIDQLPDIHRTILVLRDIEEYSTIEVADALSLSISNTKVRLHRARAALKILLDQNFGRAAL